MDDQKAPFNEADDLQAVEHLRQSFAAMKTEINKVIVGQDEVIEQLFISLFSRGHCLLQGVPGLAKTLMISSLARILDLSFNRIQFTPDLMPSDITGTDIIQEDKTTGHRELQFIKGPIFANIILADEINRTPPKTQAALLEAMQENQVSTGGKRYLLEKPFFVLATQNPIEQEGTYPLPEAQLDRFMFMVKIDYPSFEEEREIIRRTTETLEAECSPVLGGAEILQLQKVVRRVPIADQVLDYALRITRATRVKTPDAPDFVRSWVAWGAGPRAAQYLVLGAKARALLNGRFYVAADDIKAVAYPVLRHRIINSFTAEAEGITTDKVVDELLDQIDPNTSGALTDGSIKGVLKE